MGVLRKYGRKLRGGARAVVRAFRSDIVGTFGRALLILNPVTLISNYELISAKGRAREARREAERRRIAALASQSIQGNAFSSSSAHNLVFGEIRVGGLAVVYDTVPTDNKKLYVGIAHSLSHSAGVEGITDIWVDDVKVTSGDYSGDPYTGYAAVTLDRYVYSTTNMVQFRHWKGTGSQTADSQLTTDGVGSSTDYRRGIAWTSFLLTRPVAKGEDKFREAFPRGIPTLAATLRGIKCYDPRLDSTNGGSGSHRYDDNTTWEWTQNPGLIASTYMIMDRDDGGMGRDPTTIEWTVLAETADICDEDLSAGSGSPSVIEPRYACNIVLSTEDSHETNLRRILDTMWGEHVNAGGKVYIYAGAYVEPSGTIDESWLRGEVSISPKSAADGVYNSVRIIHPDKDQNYLEVEAPAFTNAAYVTQDGGRELWREEALSGVTSTWQAQRIGTLIGKLSRAQETIRMPCNWKALQVQCWDNWTVTLDEPGVNGVYRVIDWTWDGEGPALMLREDDADFYDGVSYAAPVALGDLAADAEAPDTPTNVTATATINGAFLKWDAPLGDEVERVDIYRSPESESGSPSATYAVIGSAKGYEFHDSLSDGNTYYYKVAAVTREGTSSDLSSELSVVPGSATSVGSYKKSQATGKRVEIASGSGGDASTDNEISGYDQGNTQVYRIGTSTSDGGSSSVIAVFGYEGATLQAINAISDHARSVYVINRGAGGAAVYGLVDGGSTAAGVVGDATTGSGGFGGVFKAKSGTGANIQLASPSGMSTFPSHATSIGAIVSDGRLYYYANGSKWHNLLPTWCSFDGTTTGTNAPTAGHNVTTVQRHGAGDYTITFDVDFPNANYCMSGTIEQGGAGGDGFVEFDNGGRATGTCRIHTVLDTGSQADFPYVCVQFIGSS